MDWFKKNIKWFGPTVAMFILVGGVIGPRLPMPAMAADLAKLQRTVEIMASVQVQTMVAQKQAEIRSIKRKYEDVMPIEAQLTIDRLDNEIAALQSTQ